MLDTKAMIKIAYLTKTIGKLLELYQGSNHLESKVDKTKLDKTKQDLFEF